MPTYPHCDQRDPADHLAPLVAEWQRRHATGGAK